MDKKARRLPADGLTIFRQLAERLDGASVLEGLHEPDSAFVFSALFRESPGFYLWLCLNNRQAETVASNLRLFMVEEDREKILVIPGCETDPYRGLSPPPGHCIEAGHRALEALERISGVHRCFPGIPGNTDAVPR